MEKTGYAVKAGLDGFRREFLATELKQLIAADAAAKRGDQPDCCPRCGNTYVVKRGRDADGTQRWLCRGCGRTFTTKPHSFVSSSRLDAHTWERFADGMAEGLTLRELSERCGVCMKTSWYMRQRIRSLQGV